MGRMVLRRGRTITTALTGATLIAVLLPMQARAADHTPPTGAVKTVFDALNADRSANGANGDLEFGSATGAGGAGGVSYVTSTKFDLADAMTALRRDLRRGPAATGEDTAHVEVELTCRPDSYTISLTFTNVLAGDPAPWAGGGEGFFPCGAAPAIAPVERLADTGRVATAVAVSFNTFPNADTAVLATAGDFPDALAGSVLAHAVGGPLLLTDPLAISGPVERELFRLGAGTVYLLGGPNAISAQAEADLEQRGFEVIRLAGDGREKTAVAIADEVLRLNGTVPGTYLAAAGNFPDAAAVSGLAASEGAPILLTNRDTLSQVTLAWLEDNDQRTVIVGGPAAVSDAVSSDLETRNRGGSRLRGIGETGSRYTTSHAIAERSLSDPAATLWLTTGANFPDALAAGAAVAAVGGVMHTVAPETADTDLFGDQDAIGFLHDEGVCGENLVSRIIIVGGPNAVSDNVATQVARYLDPERCADAQTVSIRRTSAEVATEATSVTFALTRDSGEGSFVVGFARAGTSDGPDTSPIPTQLRFEPGITELVLTIDILSDGATEPDESLTLSIHTVNRSTPGTSKLGDAEATVTLRDAPVTYGGLDIDGVLADPAGDDVAPEGGEYVTVRNTTGGAINAAGWSILDAAGTAVHLCDTVIAAGATLQVHTGPGTSSGTDCFNGRNRSIWNNDGDTATLRAPDGSTVDSYTY